MAGPVTVGVVANAAAGRDVRRLTTGASVVDNAEKAAMVVRLMVGLAAAGVERVLVMPAGSSLTANLLRRLDAHRDDAVLPALEFLDLLVTDTPRDTIEAVGALREAGVAAIAVLGGDGTHRLVAMHCGEIPLCTLSTGTNNAFPELREATVAGMATGLVATGRLPRTETLRREKLLAVDAGRLGTTSALVDVAVCAPRFTGSRAVWRIEDVSEIVLAFAAPTGIGLSAIGGAVDPLARDDLHALYLRLADPARAELVVTAAIAPGVVVPVGIAERRRLAPGESVLLGAGGSLALDGEREIELHHGARAEVTLRSGPLTVDVDRTMRLAVAGGLLRGRSVSAA